MWYHRLMTTDQWAEWGTVGDTFGGLANLVTLGVVLFVTLKSLPRELAKVRAEHRLQAHAEAASRIWMGTFAFVIHLKALTGAAHTSPGTFAEVQHRRMELLGPAANEFISMMGLADLHFEKPVADALMALWVARAELITDVTIQLRTGDPAAYERVYGGAAAKQIDVLKANVLGLLKPYALPE